MLRLQEIAILASWLVVVQSLSCVLLFATPGTAAHQASLSFTNSWSLLRLMSIESVMPSNHLVLCRLFSSCPQSFPALGSFLVSRLCISTLGQNIGASALASVLPINIQGWFPLWLVWSPYCPKDFQSLLQHHSLKASILWHSGLFMVQPSDLYVTAGKTIALTVWTFVGKMMSLLFNMLSRFFIKDHFKFLLWGMYVCVYNGKKSPNWFRASLSSEQLK